MAGSEELKEMEMYNQILLESKMLDFKMANLQSNISGKTEEISGLERTLKADNENIEMIQKEITVLEEHEARIRRNIEAYRESRFTIESLQTSLVHQLSSIQEKNKNTKSNHEEVLNHFTQIWQHHEKMYNMLPWVKERNKLKIELAFSKIKLSMARKEMRDEENKIRLFKDISNQRVQNAIVKFAQMMISRDEAYKKFDHQKNLNRQLREDVDKLKSDISEASEQLASRAKNAVAHVKERAERYQAKTESLSMALSSPAALRKSFTDKKDPTFNPFRLSEPPLALMKLLELGRVRSPIKKVAASTPAASEKVQNEETSAKPTEKQSSLQIENTPSDVDAQEEVSRVEECKYVGGKTIGTPCTPGDMEISNSQDEVSSQPETEVASIKTPDDDMRAGTPRPMFHRKNITLVNAQNSRFFRPGLDFTRQLTPETPLLPPKRPKKLANIPVLPPPFPQSSQALGPAKPALPQVVGSDTDQLPKRPPPSSQEAAKQPSDTQQTKHVKFASVVVKETSAKKKTQAEPCLGPMPPQPVPEQPTQVIQSANTIYKDKEPHFEEKPENKELMAAKACNSQETINLSQPSNLTPSTMSPSPLMNESARQAYFDNIIGMSPDYFIYRKHSELQKSGDNVNPISPPSVFSLRSGEPSLILSKTQADNNCPDVGGTSAGTSDFGLFFGSSKESDKKKQPSTSNFFNLNF
ncbi:hypothetical protein AAG570_005046 [Ranatra chinensis]|uniref:Uncharacterized protein n=1 Tax=Ranatra chinensis TaxID=642074 RepID=A0ABD0XZA7_9HEMI